MTTYGITAQRLPDEKLTYRLNKTDHGGYHDHTVWLDKVAYLTFDEAVGALHDHVSSIHTLRYPITVATIEIR